MKPTIQFVKRPDGVKIAFTKFGQGPHIIYPAPWVTSIILFLDDPVIWKFWEKLSQGFTVIFYDKYGCGQSDRDRNEFTMESELLDLETVVEHLKLKEMILFGASMAGPISIAYTSRRPQKVAYLILYGTFPNGKTVAKDEVKSGLISLIRSAWGLGSKTLANIFLPGADAKQAEALARFQRESCTPEIAAKLMELAYSFNVTDLLPNIETPTLILHREGDKVARLEHGRELASEIPNARFTILKGNSHLPWIGDTDGIIEEIFKFTGIGKPRIRIQSEAFSLNGEEFIKGMENLASDGSEIVEQATIVFSDIVSSTSLVTRLGDALARDIFLQHDKLVRSQLKKHKGKELQNLGDGFMLSFESATAAIKCACDIQKEISKNLPDIKVRMGINTGDILRRGGEHPFGQAVVLASRISSQAEGGVILVSDVTKHLASGSKLPFSEKGEFKPKGFEEMVKLHEVAWQDRTSSKPGR